MCESREDFFWMEMSEGEVEKKESERRLRHRGEEQMALGGAAARSWPPCLATTLRDPL